MSIEVSKVEQRFLNLKPYCHFAKEHDFVEVTEWANGEGCDIKIHTENSGIQTISLTEGEWQALTVLMNYRE